ncbi:MAG TPA: diguanylate cyclase [Methylotenera sp.]
MKFSLNLSKKVALTAMLLFCIGFLPLLIFTTAKLEKNITQLLSDQQLASTSFVASDIEQKILLRMQALQDIANNLPVDKINDPAAIKQYLSQRIAIYRLYSGGVFVIGLDGAVIADHPKLARRVHANFSEYEYFKDVIKNELPAIGKPRTGRFSHQLGVAVAVPVKNANGDLVAVMAGVIGLGDSTVFDNAKARIGKTGEYLLVSVKDELIFIDPDNMHNMMQLNEVFPENLAQDLLTGVGDTRVLYTLDHNRKYLTSTKYILDGRWLVLGMIPVDEVFQPISALKNELYAISIVSLLVITGLMWWLMHRHLKPLVIATGQLRKMVFEGAPLHELTVERNDEIGDLFQSFNKLQSEVKSSHEALESQARKDFLTGLSNRRDFMELAEAALMRSERYSRPLSVFMLDIDHFKKINDTYGHQVGDEVLRHLSEIMQKALREVDIVGRIGGEEFAVLLPETTLDCATKVAERLREKISLHAISLTSGLPLHFSVSIGVAVLNSKGLNLDTLLNFADEALYEAKRERNKVCVSKSVL